MWKVSRGEVGGWDEVEVGGLLLEHGIRSPQQRSLAYVCSACRPAAGRFVIVALENTQTKPLFRKV